MPRRRAFSLIELLVVISIIGVLLGIVLSAMPLARDAALRTRCGANLAGIGQGFAVYRADHNDAYPAARGMAPPWLSGDTDPPIPAAMTDYIEPHSGVYECPGDRVVSTREYFGEDGETNVCGVSYLFIVGLSGVTFEQSFFARFLERNPSNSPVMYDFDGGVFETQTGETVNVDFFHSTRSVLFVDGHVGTPKEFPAPAAGG